MVTIKSLCSLEQTLELEKHGLIAHTLADVLENLQGKLKERAADYRLEMKYCPGRWNVRYLDEDGDWLLYEGEELLDVLHEILMDILGTS